VTMPLKESVIPFLERTDPLSTKIGAVNTISRMPDGKFYGFNTDVAGIVGPLERRLSLRNAKVLVLGAGGAARAAVFGCRNKGAEVWILNRTPETAQKLARQAGAKTIRRDALAKQPFDVIINATPAGMNGNKTAAILAPEELNARVVFDLVYNPIETPLLRMARQKGIAVITGVEMFVQQGARQFEIWTGKPAPEEEMLRMVVHSLKQSAENANAETTPGPATRIDVGPRAAGSHADFEPAATSQPPVVRGIERPAEKQVKPAAKTAANHKPEPAKAAASGKTAGNGKNSAAKTNGKAKAVAKPAAKAASNHKAVSNHKAAAKAPAKKSAKAAPAKAKRK
jgi:3-dehydroquinate dehydratase / shikimate dehydrogenase